MNNLDQLTSIIVTYRTNHDILLDCLNSIHKDVKILIVENSHISVYPLYNFIQDRPICKENKIIEKSSC